MSLELQLKERLLSECDKLIERHQAYQNHLHLDWLRNRDRIAGAPPKDVREALINEVDCGDLSE